MKKLVFLLLFAVVSCNKSTEPNYTTQEEENVTIASKNGVTIFSGRTNPDNKMGKTGDFYINLQSSSLYGPKRDLGWGIPFAMSESSSNSGTQSTTVNTILSGNGIPTQTIGNNGDFYIDLEEYSIYGPKNDQTVWGDPVSLKADNENGVVVYTFKPVFKSNFSIDTVDYSGFFPSSHYFRVKGKSKFFAFPSQTKRLNQLYYNAYDRYTTNPILTSSTSWVNFSKGFTLKQFARSLDTGYEILEINVTEADPTQDSIFIQFDVNTITNFYVSDSLKVESLDFMLKSVAVDRIEAISKLKKNPTRFLRIK